MNRLFIKLYLDEDVDVLVADLLKVYGFTAVTTREMNRLGSEDGEQLAYAVSEGMAVLTHNRVHFEDLATAYFHAGKEHEGILIAVQRSPYEMARRVLQILNHVTADEMKNQVRYL